MLNKFIKFLKSQCSFAHLLKCFIFILIICLTSFVKVNASNEKAIRNQLSDVSKADTSLVNRYIKLSFEDQNNNPFAIYYSFDALELAKKLKYQKGVDALSRKSFTPINRDETFNSSQFSVLSSQISVLILYDSLGYYYLNNHQENKALYCFRVIERITRINTNYTNETLKKSVLNGIAGCYKRIGMKYNQEDYKISLEYYNKALNIYKGSGNKIGEGSCYNNIGVAYYNSGNNILALDNYLKSLKINEDLNYNKGIASCNLNIGLVYTKEKDYVKALAYDQKALKIFETIKANTFLWSCYNAIGSVYSSLGNNIKAIEYNNKALKICEELQDEGSMSGILNNIGDCYSDLGDYSRALDYLNKGLKLSEKNDKKINKVYLLKNIANTYLKLKRYDEALEYALMSSKSAKQLKVLNIENDGYRILKEIYKSKGDYRKEAEYADLYKITGDSLYNSVKSKQILDIQTKHEIEKKELKISTLEKEKQIQSLNFEKLKDKKRNQVILFSIIIFCLFLVIVVISDIYKRNKLRQKNITDREIALERELRYHEVIDAQENERKRIAADLHDSLGQMLASIILQMSCIKDSKELDTPENRQILKNTLGYIKDVSKELKDISHHLMPETLTRAGLIPAVGNIIGIINRANKIKINLTSNGFENRLNESAEINVFRIIQEMIQNVIQHSQATEMEINLSYQDSNISITIIDNGIGFDTTKISDAKGMGMKNIYSRVEILKGKIEVVSNPNKETKININFAV